MDLSQLPFGDFLKFVTSLDVKTQKLTVRTDVLSFTEPPPV